MTHDANAEISSGATPAYAAMISKYLGDRDPFEVLPETHDALVRATRGLSDKALRTREAEDKWSVLEVVQHLADVELTIGFRYRKVAAEDTPAITPMEQNAWVTELDYNGRNLKDALDDFRALRALNLRLLRSLPPERFERAGIHAERGRETLMHMVRLYTAHDLAHLAQIERIKKAVGATD